MDFFMWLSTKKSFDCWLILYLVQVLNKIFVEILSHHKIQRDGTHQHLRLFFPDSRPRLNLNKKHKLTDIIVLSILAILCGAESYDSIEEFGKARIDFLK